MMSRQARPYAAWILCLVISTCGMAQSAQNGKRAGRAEPALSARDATALSTALAAYDSGNSAAAKPELERLAAKYPNNFPANEALGLLYVDEGNFTRALPYLEHAATAERSNTAAQSNLGAAYLQVGNTRAAVSTLKHAAALDPRNAATLVNLGHALFLDKQPLEAANTFARASALDPANVDVSYDWAVALHEAGKDAQAADVLQRIPAGRRNEAIESLWGDVAEKQAQFKEAVEHMQAAVHLNPSEPNVYALAIELLRHWTWQPATEIAQYGVEHFPQSRRLQLAKGIAFYGSGHYVEAAASFGALLALDPDNESYGNLLGKSCSASGGSLAPQCGSLTAFADKHPANAQIAVYAAASILHTPKASGELDHVERLLQQAIRSDPKLPEAYYQLGVVQQERLQWNESAISLAKAVELRPAYAEAHYRLARAYSHLHQAEAATREMALQQKYSQQEKDDSNAKLKEVTTFLVESH